MTVSQTNHAMCYHVQVKIYILTCFVSGKFYSHAKSLEKEAKDVQLDPNNAWTLVRGILLVSRVRCDRDIQKFKNLIAYTVDNHNTAHGL